jgi:hypothetical protein
MKAEDVEREREAGEKERGSGEGIREERGRWGESRREGEMKGPFPGRTYEGKRGKRGGKGLRVLSG